MSHAGTGGASALGGGGGGGSGLDTAQMLRALDDLDLAAHPVVVVAGQVAGHLDHAGLVEAVRRHALLVGTDGQLAWPRRVLGFGAVAVAGVDIGLRRR